MSVRHSAGEGTPRQGGSHRFSVHRAVHVTHRLTQCGVTQGGGDAGVGHWAGSGRAGRQTRERGRAGRATAREKAQHHRTPRTKALQVRLLDAQAVLVGVVRLERARGLRRGRCCRGSVPSARGLGWCSPHCTPPLVTPGRLLEWRAAAAGCPSVGGRAKTHRWGAQVVGVARTRCSPCGAGSTARCSRGTGTRGTCTCRSPGWRTRCRRARGGQGACTAGGCQVPQFATVDARGHAIHALHVYVCVRLPSERIIRRRRRFSGPPRRRLPCQGPPARRRRPPSQRPPRTTARPAAGRPR